MRTRMLAVAIALVLAAPAAFAQSPPAASIGDAFRNGKPLLDVRARWERVDDDAFARDAEALTLRTRLGFRTAPWHGWSALLEAEDVRAPIEDYNSTANGRTQYPVVADPEGSEINQAWIGWGNQGTQVALGRQRILLDNHRFIGNSGFRQNEQTFDAVALTHAAGTAWTLRWAWLDSVQKVNGNDNPNPLLREQELDAHLLNVQYRLPFVTLTGYGYLIENEDVPLASTRTLGVRATGQRELAGRGRLAWTAELAKQDDWRDGNPLVEARYHLVEGTWSLGRHSVRAAHERLGGDGRAAFQTPLATLHAFNGWADKFTTTPATGLRDTCLEYGAKLGKGQLVVRHHRFDADAGDAHYGDEWDASYTWPLGTRMTLQAKLARYDADELSRDTDKAWLAFEYRLP